MEYKERVIEQCKQAVDSGEPVMDYQFYYRVLALLKEQEAVVRCKDCKHHLECNNWIENDDEWFCADGEREKGR